MATRRPTPRRRSPAFTADVALIGAGPVGLVLANTLGLQGLRVLLIEKLPKIIDYPRAIGIDDEALRTIQSVGLAAEVEPHLTPDHWMRFVTAQGRCFASIEPRTDEFGWSRRNAFIQPEIDRILYQGLQRFKTIDIRLGHGLTGFAQDDEGVDLALANEAGEESTARVRWMVACDGGNSLVRRTLGIGFEGRTKPNQWIVVDVRNDPIGTPHVYLHCDPQRPYVSAALPHGIRRFEFMVMPGESEKDFEDPAQLARLMGKVLPEPDKVDVIRKRVYTHNARLAARFREGRILLAGDAAHIMPVWQGQGYNSGLRDAFNLGWKLACVVQGRADAGLLDTYEAERRDHARMMIHLSEVAGDIFAPASARAARVRDAATLALNAVPAIKQYFVEMRFKPMPRYEHGAVVNSQAPAKAAPSALARLIDRSGDTAAGRLLGLMAEKRDSLVGRLVNGLDAPQPTPVGRMFIQPKVLCEDGVTRRLDDLIGPRFAVIAWGTDPTWDLDEDTRAFWAGMQTVFLSARPVGQLAWAADVQPDVIRIGDVGNRLKDWFAQWPQSVVLLRPDRFVGAVCSPQQVAATTRAFAQALHAKVRP